MLGHIINYDMSSLPFSFYCCGWGIPFLSVQEIFGYRYVLPTHQVRHSQSIISFFVVERRNIRFFGLPEMPCSNIYLVNSIWRVILLVFFWGGGHAVFGVLLLAKRPCPRLMIHTHVNSALVVYHHHYYCWLYIYILKTILSSCLWFICTYTTGSGGGAHPVPRVGEALSIPRPHLHLQLPL